MNRWKVMVVDDEAEIADYVGDLVRETLGDTGEIEVFYSGTRAKKRLAQQAPDLLMTDIVMPVTDGFELLEYAAENLPDTEVILLTAYEEFSYIYRANKIKRCRYIVKTEQEDMIKSAIRSAAEVLEEKRSGRESVETAKKQIEEVKQIFSEEKARQMISYEGEGPQHDQELIRRIKGYIKEHSKEDLTAALIAEKFHYSPAYLSKIFRQYGKEKLSAYIMEQKLQGAKKMLLETDKSIQEISQESGYLSPQAFARAFRRELGITPQEYRREYAGRKMTET